MIEATASRREALLRMLHLKDVARKGWTRHAIPPGAVESVADHSFGVALLAWLLCPDELDSARVLELALIHDLAETVTGDITPADGVPADAKKTSEMAALDQLLRDFPRRERGLALLEEYQGGVTAEARFLKGMDRLDMGLQSLIYERAFGLDLGEFRESGRVVLEGLSLQGWVEES